MEVKRRIGECVRGWSVEQQDALYVASRAAYFEEASMRGEEEAFDLNPTFFQKDSLFSRKEKVAFFYEEVLPSLNLERYDEEETERLEGSTVATPQSHQKALEFIAYAREELADADFVALLHCLSDYARSEDHHWGYLALKVHKLLQTTYPHVLLSFRNFFLSKEAASNIPCQLVRGGEGEMKEEEEEN